MTGTTVDLQAVNGAVRSDAGIPRGARLLAFTEAVMGGDADTLARERQALRAVLDDEQFVDTCALIGAFNVVDRVADATGLQLDPMMSAMSGDLPQQLQLTRFQSAANTPAMRS